MQTFDQRYQSNNNRGSDQHHHHHHHHNYSNNNSNNYRQRGSVDSSESGSSRFTSTNHHHSYNNHHKDKDMSNNTNYQQHSMSNSSGSQRNNSGSSGSSGEKSDFERLVFKLKNDPVYRKEIMNDKVISFYKVGIEIGSGNFSQVRLGLHLLTRDKIAIKILNKTKLDEKTQRLLLREISSMQNLHHPNIIRLYEVIHTPTRLYICMEYAPDGELFTRINDYGKIREPESKLIFSQIISAVHHMHSINIIHRDIKAENIFFSNSNPILVKIGDFGFSIEASTEKLLNTYCGSPPYAAPELFRDDNYTGIYVDIWALGVLLYYMVTGTMPFKAETVSKLKRVILSGNYSMPASLSESCRLLIRGVLKLGPTDRYSIREIMDSAWLDGETFTKQLEPYQLNLQQQQNQQRPEIKEEIYSKRVLEKLGITHDLLMYSNLKENAKLSASAYQSSYETYGSDYNAANSSIHMRSLVAKSANGNNAKNHSNSSNSTNNISSQIKIEKHLQQMMTHDIQLAINGTYRIVFHKLQKKIRNELSSEDVLLQQMSHNEKAASLTSSTKQQQQQQHTNQNSIQYNIDKKTSHNKNKNVNSKEDNEPNVNGGLIMKRSTSQQVQPFYSQMPRHKSLPHANTSQNMNSVFMRVNSPLQQQLQRQEQHNYQNQNHNQQQQRLNHQVESEPPPIKASGTPKQANYSYKNSISGNNNNNNNKNNHKTSSNNKNNSSKQGSSYPAGNSGGSSGGNSKASKFCSIL